LFSALAPSSPALPCYRPLDEADGREYHFVTEEEFEVLKGANRMLESGRHNGHQYGTLQPTVENAARSENATKQDLVLRVRAEAASVPPLPPSLAPPKVIVFRPDPAHVHSAVPISPSRSRSRLSTFLLLFYVVLSVDLFVSVDKYLRRFWSCPLWSSRQCTARMTQVPS